MPAECMAQKINPWVPEQNIQATVRVLKRNLDRFSHLGYSDQIYNALAAYNAGYYAVLRYGGVPPYEETRNYVRKVVSTWRFICGLR
jgi:soluble lytic murein transglycosylase-like protein